MTSGFVDEHCDLHGGLLFEDYHCLLTLVDGKSDKFYLIQLLKNPKGHYVWTRWGRNGTTGQSKLEGPMKKSSDAVKSFQKKFQDKTKNNWEDRSKFQPKKGKYTLVGETRKLSSDDVQQPSFNYLASLEAEKPSFPDTVVSGKNLNAELLYQIMSSLSTKDVLNCMEVCKFWKMVLSEKYFWKMLIYQQFDLTLMSDVKDESPFGQWSDPEEWFCYYDNEDDSYVIRPFPSMWKCGVVHPAGLDPMSGDVKSLQGFSRSLEILTHMRKGTKIFSIYSGNECSASEGCDHICEVLFPWSEEELPGPTTILTKIFQFHPEICEQYLNKDDQGERRSGKLHYHLPSTPDGDDDDDNEHDLEDKPCLNRIFGFGSYSEEEGQSASLEEAHKFYTWLQKIMVPTITVYAGEEKLNPVAVFFLTKLAPGWVGGALTGVTYT